MNDSLLKIRNNATIGVRIGMKPTVTVTPPSSNSTTVDQIFNSKVTATLLILIDAAVIWIIAAGDDIGKNTDA
ncbi:hypothetical protein Y032_0042g528 [Ancylostoma ceylanicum]|uniref:Uncharacterized protein n=1 Tax=Ancylostoma ceylanicum TaxID=53326 RepID=A0A016UF43_9BILA|nr:hypothetical protein Y032_0042g528 [Ancylostoma ceylanicum]